MPKFIWVRGNCGPEPQLIMDESAVLDGHGKMRSGAEVLASHVLYDGEPELGLAVLAEMYPAPKEE